MNFADTARELGMPELAEALAPRANPDANRPPSGQGTPITDRLRQRVRDRHLDGASPEAIAAECRISVAAVHEILSLTPTSAARIAEEAGNDLLAEFVDSGRVRTVGQLAELREIVSSKIIEGVLADELEAEYREKGREAARFWRSRLPGIAEDLGLPPAA